MPESLRLFLVAAMLAAGLGASPLGIQNGDAAIAVDPDSVFGLLSYSIGGEEQIFEEQYWYHTPGIPFEQPVNTLQIASESASGNGIQVSYRSGSFGADFDYRLTGGPSGMPYATLRETITLRNLTNVHLPIGWFMEADFDLSGFGGADFASGGVAGIDQTDGSQHLQVRSSLLPTAFQIAAFPDLFLSLGDFSETNLDNTGSPFGPGDATFAFQWNLDLPANGSVSFVVDKNFVPEPSASVLLLLGFVLLAFRAFISNNLGRSNHGIKGSDHIGVKICSKDRVSGCARGQERTARIG